MNEPGSQTEPLNFEAQVLQSELPVVIGDIPQSFSLEFQREGRVLVPIRYSSA